MTIVNGTVAETATSPAKIQILQGLNLLLGQNLPENPEGLQMQEALGAKPSSIASDLGGPA